LKVITINNECHFKDCEENKYTTKQEEENQILSNEWFSANSFRSYFTETIAARSAMELPLVEVHTTK